MNSEAAGIVSEKGGFETTNPLSMSNLRNTGQKQKPTLRTKVEILEKFTQSQTVKIDKLHEDVEATLKLLSDAADEMKVQDNTDHALTAKVEVMESVLNDHQAAIEQQEKFAQVFDTSGSICHSSFRLSVCWLSYFLLVAFTITTKENWGRYFLGLDFVQLIANVF